MNGRNGNVLESYYQNIHKPDWSLVVAFCTLILALSAVVYYTAEKQTDLKIENSALRNENTNLKFRNEMQKQILEQRYAPSTAPPP